MLQLMLSTLERKKKIPKSCRNLSMRSTITTTGTASFLPLSNIFMFSHLVTVHSGQFLSDALMLSPVVVDAEATGGATSGGGSEFEFGVDPNLDPELALVNIPLVTTELNELIRCCRHCAYHSKKIKHVKKHNEKRKKLKLLKPTA